MIFIVYEKDNEIVCKTVHMFCSIQTFIDQNNLVREECKIFDGNRLTWNKCHKEWQHSVVVTCSKCGGDMTGYDHGEFPCGISYEDGCPDKGDGGW